MKSWTIVGYTYRAENWMPNAIVAQLTTNPGNVHHKSASVPNAEAHLDLLARIAHIDRYDESSYDSDDFPKVIFADSVEEGETFRDCDGSYVDPIENYAG